MTTTLTRVKIPTPWWVPESMPKEVVRGYLRGLERAERSLQTNLPKYLPLWKYAVPPDFAGHPWDFSRFTRGERFVFKPVPREQFDEVFKQVERWGLDQYIKEHSYEKLTYSVAG